MAFDGLFIHALVTELNTRFRDTRLNKITQPEPDELILTVKAQGETVKLLLSADASLPVVYEMEEGKPSPLTAPGFCMLLRKHLQGARIVSITQPGLERIIHFNLEHLNEMGDLCYKKLVVEIMGKHSNIIFVDDNETIVDSIRHVSPSMSSIRTVLPGRPYFIAPSQDKKDLTHLSKEEAKEALLKAPGSLGKAIYQTFTGIAPVTAQECLYLAGIDPSLPASVLSGSREEMMMAGVDENSADRIIDILFGMIEKSEKEACPLIYSENGNYKDFTPFAYRVYDSLPAKEFERASVLLCDFYSTKNAASKMKQKSADLRKLVQNLLEKSVRKYELFQKQMEETKEKEQLRIYGELLQTYGYLAEPNASEITVDNYYTNEPITIPLDQALSGIENSKKYFAKYSKLKRTAEALEDQILVEEAQKEHLASVLLFLDTIETEEDLTEIREELKAAGHIKKTSGQSGKKQQKSKAGKPLHYISSDGFDIYVGKNNIQNELLTFKEASGSDWWFHAKKAPGSHVIVKCLGKELPDRTFEEAARLAGFYSSLKGTDKVEIDYTQKKNIKKPAGAVPGYVIYHTNYSMLIDTDISAITRVD